MSSGATGSGEPDEPLITRLHAVLRSAGVDLSPRELSDALWLALHTPSSRAEAVVAGPATVLPSGPASAAVPQSQHAEGDAAEATPSQVRRPVYALTSTRDGGTPGAPLRIPGVRGLRHPLSIVRGLRALKRRVPSEHRYELDETATAEAIADSGVLDAVLRAAADRWLHLVLAVDHGPSMRVWRDTVGELADALTGSGIFRSVRTSPLGASVPVTGGRTAVLVVTDGVADHWHRGDAYEHLATLARAAPTAVIHLFPARLWRGTGLSAEPMIVRTTGLAPPNSLLAAHDPWLPASLSPRPGLPVPVLELGERSLRPWADLIASHGGVAPLRVVDAERPHGTVSLDHGTGSDSQTAADCVRTFRATASPQAYELAGHLAAVDPLTLPVMRLVQAAALPDSNPVCLAEVLLSGLMHVGDPLEGHDVFDFAPDVRGVLRTVIRSGSAQRTIDAVSDFITPRLGRSPDFPAVIADRTGTLTLPRDGEPLAELAPTGRSWEGAGEREWERPSPWSHGVHNLPARRTTRWLPALEDDVVWVGESLARTDGVPTVLCGPAGSDKSTIALEYAHRHLSDYSVVWWVDAHFADTLANGIASLAEVVLPEGFSADSQVTVERVLSWLQSHTGWLLVLDHVTENSEVDRLVSRVGAALGHVLMTTRREAGDWAAARDLTPAYRLRHDVLTGVRNGPTVREQLSGLLCADPEANDDPGHRHLRLPPQEPETGGWGLAVLFCALKGVESINTGYGRSVGDAVLNEVARRLRDAVGDDNTVARVGGDEFVILAGELGRAEAATLALRLQREITQPIQVQGHMVRPGAGVGIGWARCGTDADRVIESARQRSLGPAQGVDLLRRLSELLQTLAQMEDSQGRQAFAEVLGEQLDRRIDLRGVRLREDVVTLVRAALDVPDGERVLADVVGLLEGDTAARQLDLLLASSGVPAVSWPEAGRSGRAHARGQYLVRLTEFLCGLRALEDPSGRAQFAVVLRSQLDRRIDLRGVRLREDVVTLVRAALDVPEGKQVLVDVVRVFEGGAAADELAQIASVPDPSVPSVLSTAEEDEARSLLRAASAELSAARLRDALAHDLNGYDLPAGLSAEQLFELALLLTAQPDGLPPAVLLVDRAALFPRSPGHRSALAAWAEAWAANAGLSEALRRRRAAEAVARPGERGRRTPGPPGIG